MDSRAHLALTESGSLYVAIPREGRHVVSRVRRGSSESAMLLGVLGSAREVTALEAATEDARLIVLTRPCRLMSFVPGSPVHGQRLALELGSSSWHVTSRVTWTRAIEADRSWVVELVARAYGMELESWQRLLDEQEYELGLEGIKDDSSGLTRQLREDVWNEFLARERAAQIAA